MVDEASTSEALSLAARAFVGAAFALVRSRVAPGPATEDYSWEWVRIDADRFRHQARPRHWWEETLSLLGAFGDLERLPESAPFQRLILQDPEIGHLCGKMVGTESTSQLLELPKVAGLLIWRVARDIGERELDLEGFDEGYASWRSDLTSTIVRQTWVAPLLGLKAPSRPINLTPQVAIAPLDDAEISRLLLLRMLPSGDMSSMGGPPTMNVAAEIHGLRIVYETPRLVLDQPVHTPLTSPWRANNDLFEDVLIALRAFKDGHTASSGMAIFYTTWPLQASTNFGPLVDLAPPFPRRHLQYSLTEQEASEFENFFRAYLKAKVAIGFAARRFAYAAERTRAEDRIIDLMIASEAIFLEKQDAELKFRLALRAACFLYPEYPSRSATLSFFKNAYDLRSKIAHGSSLDDSKLKRKLTTIDGVQCKGPYGFADALEAVLRVVIRKAIKQVASEGSFMSEKDWEALVLRDDLETG